MEIYFFTGESPNFSDSKLKLSDIFYIVIQYIFDWQVFPSLLSDFRYILWIIIENFI